MVEKGGGTLQGYYNAGSGNQNCYQSIEDDEDFSHHFDDVHYNPVKHGLVNGAGDWPWSSFHRWVRGERASSRLGGWFDLRHERVNGAFDRRTVTPKVIRGCMTYLTVIG